jgi:hypothetical protein
MKTVLLCVGFYSLGVFNCAVFAAVYLLHRPRYVAPTKYNRKWRDLPTPAVQPPWEREESGVDYRFINLTGLEE